MKVLVYGSKGWIGGQFVHLLDKNNVAYCEGTSRIENVNSVRKELDAVQPTHVISVTGRLHGSIGEKIYTSIDYLEQEGKLVENVRDNLYGPIVLSTICKEKNIHYTYFGTGCLFKYDNNHKFGTEENGFTEDALPNYFGSSYSVVKGFTDQLMKFFINDALNLRIRMPLSDSINMRNFITKVASFEYICSIPNSMTVLPTLLPLVLDMMRSKLTGAINLTNPGLISHNEILDMYKDIVDPHFTYKNFSIEEQRAILASERSNNYLNTIKLQSLYPCVLPIKEAVRNCLIGYKTAFLNKSEQIP